MVEPRWFSPRGAAIIRGGVSYNNILSRFWLKGNFVAEKENISRVKYSFSFRKLEKKYFDNLNDAGNDAVKDNTHYIFRWNAWHNFIDLQQHHDFIYEHLWKITAPKHKKFVGQFEPNSFIGIHIRSGKDFLKKTSDEIGSYRTELDWFIDALQKARKSYGDLPAFVFSDGGEKQLQALLNISNTRLINSTSAISDILLLAKAKVLLGSGNSSFSAWASFLGRMDTFSSEETPFDQYVINYQQSSTQVVSTM